MTDILVAGMGNPLMSDEGAGIAVLKRLRARAEDFPGVTFMDLGTAAMRALHEMGGRKKAVFVDCALMGEPPGAIRRFTPEQVRTQKRMSGLSLHEGDLLRTIELSRQLGECPPQVVIFGIEPADTSPGDELSPELRSRLDDYTEAVTSELRDVS